MWHVDLHNQDVCMQKLEEEVARLQAANAELLKDKEEALPLLEAYRSAHSSLDSHLAQLFPGMTAHWHEANFAMFCLVQKGWLTLTSACGMTG